MNLDTLRYYTGWHQFANRNRYEAPADPWKLVQVDPQRPDCYNSEHGLKWGLGRIAGGEWDRAENCHPLTETTTYKGLTQRFEAGYDWEETAIYRRAEERIATDGSARGYESIEAFRNERCAYLDDLFERIEQGGYRPNHRGTHDNPAADENPFEDAYVHHLEPLVVVGRSGEIHWTEGYHRLFIARILDVDEIPVQVLCRHENWQRIRDEIHGSPTAELPAAYREDADHPDLRDVRS